jgi:hypothetical protein
MQASIFRFFQNTGAVAGVFTAVGLVAVVIIITIIINIIRHRQAQKFDREIAEAAAEAAVARAPAFLDDDTNNYGPGGYGGAFAAKYSDVSHGTYSQPPMTESYGMREMVPGEVYDPAIYGVAGIGQVQQELALLAREVAEISPLGCKKVLLHILHLQAPDTTCTMSHALPLLVSHPPTQLNATCWMLQG